jgi:hypothetical protein
MTDLMVQPRLFSVPQHDLTSDDYYTPAWVFERMGIEFDLDVCAPPGGIPWIPAKRYFTQADGGLVQPWEGRVWMNPPFSGTRPWVERFITHGHGICLTQTSKGQYTHAIWSAADAIWLCDVDMMFVVATEGKRSDVYMPLMFAAFGDECVDAISRLGTVRKVVA